MALRGSAGLGITVSSGGSTDHSDEFRPWWQHGPLDINMASCGSSKCRYPNGPWWQYGPWTSPQTPDMVGPWTQTWSWTSSWLQVAAQALSVGLLLTAIVFPVPLSPQRTDHSTSLPLFLLFRSHLSMVYIFSSLHHIFAGHRGRYLAPATLGQMSRDSAVFYIQDPSQ